MTVLDNITADITVKDSGGTNFEIISKLINDLNTIEMYVGIPQEKSSRPGEKITNAELAFVHSMGFTSKWKFVFDSYLDRWAGVVRRKSDNKALMAYRMSFGEALIKVPPRPFLIPALEANMLQIQVKFKIAYKGCLTKRSGEDDYKNFTRFARIGMFCVTKVKQWFTDPANGWPPNNPIIIKIKGSDKPLIDTGELRKSITYVLEMNGKTMTEPDNPDA